MGFFDRDKLRVLDIPSIMQSYHSYSIRNILFSFMPRCVQTKSSQECATASNPVGQQAGITCVCHPFTFNSSTIYLHIAYTCGLQDSSQKKY